MEWDKLWTINKKIIDPVCARHTAVNEERRVLLLLSNGPETPFVRIIPRHKKYEGAGTKATTYTQRIWIDFADASAVSENEEVTLMDWGNAIIKEIKKDGEGNVTFLTGVLHLEGSVKTTKLKLTWLPETDELVRLSLIEYGYLITKKKVLFANVLHFGVHIFYSHRILTYCSDLCNMFTFDFLAMLLLRNVRQWGKCILSQVRNPYFLLKE